MRSTRQRQEIIRALTEAGRFLTVRELHERLGRGGPRVGLATVYRAVRTLSRSGDVDVLRSGGEASYRLCAQDRHHHHLVCRDCGRAVEVVSPQIESWAKSMGRRHRFTDVSHEVELFGRCSDCRGGGQ
ncbi:MAG TPA: Fur family transcriptional regulator [Actinomycetota bacterium]|nr:Fur family transcriptional regulator [Actinomycetota bacterium]